MVKNIEHSKRTTSSPMKGDEHSFDFKGDSPLFPNLGGQASQQGGVKGRAIANYKNLLRITIWAEEFFHRGVDQNPLSAVRSPHSLRCSV